VPHSPVAVQPLPTRADTDVMRRGPSAHALVVLVLILAVVVPALSWARQGSAPASHGPNRMADTRLTASTASQSCPLQSILPAYFYPGASWQTALATATSSSTIIVNPSSGPGTSPDPKYLQVVASAQAKGAQLLGYIDTGYTSLSLADVEQQVSDYRSW
jgi:Spherulation-specific family 4